MRQNPHGLMDSAEIRELDSISANDLAIAFGRDGWNKPDGQYAKYLQQHEAGEILCLVAYVAGQITGYLKLVWKPQGPALRDQGIPEIQDLNVLDQFRRRGVASRLIDNAERHAPKRSAAVGIGVGLHPGYSAAQRLYVLRGYVPDAKGVTYKDKYVNQGQTVVMDDDLVLHFIKELREHDLRHDKPLHPTFGG